MILKIKLIPRQNIRQAKMFVENAYTNHTEKIKILESGIIISMVVTSSFHFAALTLDFSSVL